MKTIGIIVVTVGLFAVVAAIFAASLGQFAVKCGLPALSWWHSFCFLICVVAIGGAFGYVGGATK